MAEDVYQVLKDGHGIKVTDTIFTNFTAIQTAIHATPRPGSVQEKTFLFLEPELCEFRAVEEHMYSVESEVENATNIKDCEVFCRKQDKFNCRAFRFDEETKKCVLSGDDRSSLRNSHVDQQLPEGQAPGQVLFGYMERGECIDSKYSCSHHWMQRILRSKTGKLRSEWLDQGRFSQKKCTATSVRQP